MARRGWSFNPAAAVGVAAATLGVLGLSALALAMFNGGGDTPPPGGAADGGPAGRHRAAGPPGLQLDRVPLALDPGTERPADPDVHGRPAQLARVVERPRQPSPTPGPTATPTPTPTPSAARVRHRLPHPHRHRHPRRRPPHAPVGPVLTLSLESLGDLVAGRTGVIGFTAGNTGDTSTTGLTADIALPPGVTLSGTPVRRGGAPGRGDAGRRAVRGRGRLGLLRRARRRALHRPDVPEAGTVTAYLDVTAAADSAGTTPVSVTVGAPGTESVTVTGTTGVAASGYAASFADSGHLAVTEVGAPLLSCPAQAKGCAEALARTATGNALNNDSWAMVGLDDDADKATRTSSSTTLELPEGATVTWAGLYWSANVPAGASTDSLGRILLAGPGATTYSEVLADRVETGASTGRGPAYQAFADVTAEVAAGGAGAWWAADAVAEPGLARYAGWSLVVVYSDDSVPVGRVSVVDGFTSVAPGTDVELTLPGTAGLNARVGLVAWEGDAGIDGDILRLDGGALTPELGDQAENNVADSSALGRAVPQHPRRGRQAAHRRGLRRRHRASCGPSPGRTSSCSGCSRSPRRAEPRAAQRRRKRR